MFLHVTGRRSDGLHLLDSLVVFAGVGDRVTAAPADSISLEIDGTYGDALRAEAENLVLRAARRLARDGHVHGGAALRLHKRLPVASGIGGGSADAAATLRLLRRLWRLDLNARQLLDAAASLGADVPVCLASQPRRMAGIGELLSPAPAMAEFGLVLVNPLVALATADVFRARDPAFSAAATLPSGWPDANGMAADLRALRNDLEAPARLLCPAIDDVLGALRGAPGCLLARMSGSGATCFGIWPTPEAATRAAAALGHAAWWIWGGAPFVP